ncbi:MAG TPA: dUTP diphosphatase [Micromonosporaceae bacterium]
MGEQPAAVRVTFQRLDPDLPPPCYAHEGDAGADLFAAVDIELKPGERSLIPTGLAIALPLGYVGLVHPRSGLAARLGVTVLNAPGTVDAGYRGEILVNLVNHDPRNPALIRRGDRIAQLVVQRVERADFWEVTQLPGSARGAGGHGSTGGVAALGGQPGSSQGQTPNALAAGSDGGVSGESE